MGARSSYLIGAALWAAGVIGIPAAAHDRAPPIISIPLDGSSSTSRAGLLALMGTLRGIREQLRSLENQAEIENHEISRLRAQQQAFFADFDRQLRHLKGGGQGAGGSQAPQSPPDAASGSGTTGQSAAPAPSANSGITVIPPDAGSPAPKHVSPPPPSIAGGTAATGPTGTLAGTPAGTPGQTAHAAYQHAFDLLRAGRYRHAVSAFQTFLRDYPQDRRASQAQYWVAETDYVERDYPKASRAFKALVTHYPASKKVPNALLKMGYIAKWQGHPGKARSTWQQLIARYPKSMAAQVARNSLTNLGPGT